VVPAGPFREAQEGLFPPEQPSKFAAIHASTPSRPVINPEYAIQQLALNGRFQSDVKLSSEEIIQVLSKPWSVQEALGNCKFAGVETEFATSLTSLIFVAAVEGQLYEISRRSSPRRAKLFLNDAARPGSALSLQSYNQNGQRGIDVGDLRDALGQLYSSVPFCHKQLRKGAVLRYEPHGIRHQIGICSSIALHSGHASYRGRTRCGGSHYVHFDEALTA
jgi:hypothetical protein